MLQLHFVSRNVDGFLWTPPTLWGGEALSRELRCCQVSRGQASTARPSVQPHVLAQRPVLLGACATPQVSAELQGIRFSECLLSMTLSMFGVKGKDCLPVRSLRVMSVHQSLTFLEGVEEGKCTCLQNSEQSSNFSPWENLNFYVHFFPSCCQINPVYFSHHGHPPHLLSKMGWRGSWADGKTFVQGLWQC